MSLKVSLHGTLLSINNHGVLLIGKSSVGKSELALALVDRGHQLIADDMVDIERKGQRLMGKCPPVIYGYLHVHAIGILDVKKLYGKNAVKKQQALDLVIHLLATKVKVKDHFEPVQREKKILSVSVPEFFLPLGRLPFLPIKVEAMVNNFYLTKRGENVRSQFFKHHERFIQ